MKYREITEGGVGKKRRGVGRMYAWNLIAQKEVTAIYKAIHRRLLHEAIVNNQQWEQKAKPDLGDVAEGAVVVSVC